ncbi:MAG TPA: hypothetical protein PLP14_09080 [Chitinophagaceae bacterium]|nr:hypothetical protein [Chitinophagaceae bacterium]
MYSHFEAITESNYQQVARIYQQGMDEGNATFELTAPHWEQWNASHLYPGRIALFHEEVMTGCPTLMGLQQSLLDDIRGVDLGLQPRMELQSGQQLQVRPVPLQLLGRVACRGSVHQPAPRRTK